MKKKLTLEIEMECATNFECQVAQEVLDLVGGAVMQVLMTRHKKNKAKHHITGQLPVNDFISVYDQPQ